MPLGNTPTRRTDIYLERAKSFALDVRFEVDGEPYDLRDHELRLVVVGPIFGTEVLVKSAEIFDAAPYDSARFPLQAADLDLEPGGYQYDVTLLTPGGYSTPMIKGTLVIGGNADPDVSNVYQCIGGYREVVVSQDSCGSITVCVEMADGLPGPVGPPGPPLGVYVQPEEPVAQDVPKHPRLWIDTDAVYVPPAGPQGPAGAQGPAGPPGPDGGIAALIVQPHNPGDPSQIDPDRLVRYPLWINTSATAGGGGGSSGGTSVHGELSGRSALDQHPVSAITGLQAALNARSPLLVVPSLADVPAGTPAGTVIVVSASAPPPPGSTPSIVSYTKGGVAGTTVALARPTGLQAGDWLFAFIAHQGSTTITGFTPEAGFSQAAWAFAAPAPADTRVNYVVKKLVTDPVAEPASYSFTVLGGGTQRCVAIMLAIRGADAANPVSVHAGPVSRTNTAPEIPSVTVPDENSLAIGLIHTTCTLAPDTSHTAPGWTLAATRDYPEGQSATASTNRLTLFTKQVGAGVLPLTVAAAAGGAAVSSDGGAVVVIRP